MLAFTDAASVTGEYAYALTERWSLGATVGAYSNRYEAIESDAALSNNHGYYASGNVGYAYSDRTQFTFVTGYTYDDSNVARSSGVTATVGAVHQFSPQLTVSASAGVFWSDTEAIGNSLAGGNHRRDSGGLYRREYQLRRVRAHAGWRQPFGKPDAQQLRHAQQDRYCFRLVDPPVLGTTYRSTRSQLHADRDPGNDVELGDQQRVLGRDWRSLPACRALAARCRLPVYGRTLRSRPLASPSRISSS